MTNDTDIDYENLEEALAENDCETTAVELQSIICGMLSAKPQQQLVDCWKAVLFDVLDDEHDSLQAVESHLEHLFAWTQKQINQQDSLAPLLLPDENYPLVDQLTAIVDWCHGFLLGFGLLTDNQSIENVEVRESLIDLTDISQLELTSEEDESTQEALYTLIEHIKVAVQIIHWEMVISKPRATNHESHTLH